MNTSNREKGQVLVMMSLSIFLLMGMLALVVDVGWAYFRRNAAQSAADAAAIAAVRAAKTPLGDGVSCPSGSNSALSCDATPKACASTLPKTPGQSDDNGCMYAAALGFKGASVTMQGNTDTAGFPLKGITPYYWAVARVKETTPLFFGGWLSHTSPLNPSAISYAALIPANQCVYALDPTAADSLEIFGGNTVNLNCGVVVDSSSPVAYYESGGASLNAGGNPIHVVGKHLFDNNSTASPKPNDGSPYVDDPLGGLAFPAVPNQQPISGNFTGYQASPIPVSPGYYDSLQTGNSVTLNLAPGRYIIAGGPVTFAGGTTVNGTGVTIFLTTGSGQTAKANPVGGTSSMIYPIGSYWGVNDSSGQGQGIANGAFVNLSAPTSGPYQGILFFQDRSYVPKDPSVDGGSYFAGGANTILSGAIYFPTTKLYLSNAIGSAITGANVMLVADEISFGVGGAGADVYLKPTGYPPAILQSTPVSVVQ